MSGPRIYTGAEALALREAAEHPVAPTHTHALTLTTGETALLHAAPDLAASVAHHEARAQRAEADRDAALAHAAEFERALHVVRSTAEREADDVLALRAERDALRAIVEGQTTLPTDAEALAHDRAGGRWLVLRASGGTIGRSDADLAVFGLGVAWISPTPTDDFPGAERVWPLDATGRPCAWPAATESPDAR